MPQSPRTAASSAARKPLIQNVRRLIAPIELGSRVTDLMCELLADRAGLLSKVLPDGTDLLRELLPDGTDLLGELLPDGTDLLGQLLADERDLLADVVARGDFLNHLALDDLDHAGSLLVGETSSRRRIAWAAFIRFAAGGFRPDDHLSWRCAKAPCKP
jgi:hypothetical protein